MSAIFANALDLREVAPPQRHALIFSIFESMLPGQALELINDHDPQPLNDQFQMRSPGQFEHRLIARGKAEMVAAALANGVIPAHNVCLDLKNTDVVKADATRARNEFGFLRMWSIYPAQIQAIVDAMKPDHSEVEDAAHILLAAQAVDWGPIQYKGELHDRATYRYFWELLQKAKVTGVKILPAANAAFFES